MLKKINALSLQNAKSSALANWESEQAKVAQGLDTTGASDEELRLIGKIKEEGIGALDSADLDSVSLRSNV